MESKVFETEKCKLNYRIYIPENISNNCTLILWMHGAGERGTDNARHITENDTFLKKYFSKGYSEKYPAIVIAPQCPQIRESGEEARWVDWDWSKGSFRDPVFESPEINSVIKLCDFYINKYNLDMSKSIITGISMGGFATWDIITRYPDKFRTALPVCGGGCIAKAEQAKNTRIRTFHSADDDIVPVSATRDMAAVLGKFGIDYKEYDSEGHGCWERAYNEEDTFVWLFDF